LMNTGMKQQAGICNPVVCLATKTRSWRSLCACNCVQVMNCHSGPVLLRTMPCYLDCTWNRQDHDSHIPNPVARLPLLGLDPQTSCIWNLLLQSDDPTARQHSLASNTCMYRLFSQPVIHSTQQQAARSASNNVKQTQK